MAPCRVLYRSRWSKLAAVTNCMRERSGSRSRLSRFPAPQILDNFRSPLSPCQRFTARRSVRQRLKRTEQSGNAGTLSKFAEQSVGGILVGLAGIGRIGPD